MLRTRSPLLSLAVLTSALALGACSSSSGTGDDGSPSTEDPGDPGEPGDPTIENSYDAAFAHCDIASNFAGDGVCVLPPDPADGFQVHYGPDDYDDPDQMAKFTLPPNGEIDDEVPVVSGNDQEIFFNEYHTRLRPGTHHLILWAAEGNGPAIPGLARFLLGAQAALGPEGGRFDVPVDGEPVAPENQGLGQRLPAHTKIQFNLHYVNTTDEPLLREGWVNVHYANPDNVTQIMDPVTFYGGLGMAVQPHTNEVVKASCSYGGTGEPLRIVGLTGHMHAHGARFTAYKVNLAGERERIYETFNWSEPENIEFNSIKQNEEPDAVKRSGGGATGEITVSAGEKIEYECEFHNPDNMVLRFANEAYTAEMCNLFGFYTPSTGGPWTCWNQ